MRLSRWLFWHTWYLFQPKPRDLASRITRACRLRPPWWRFSPGVFFNDAGRQWEVYFKNESYFVASRRWLLCEINISQETGEVVGLTVFDEDLRRLANQVGDDMGMRQ